MTNDKSCDGQNFTHLANLQFSPNRSFWVISHPIWETKISQNVDFDFVSEIEEGEKQEILREKFTCFPFACEGHPGAGWAEGLLPASSAA